MATEVSYNGDGSDKTFDITFPFLKDSHVKASVGGVTKNVTTDYSISGTVVTFVTAPPSGTANVRLFRQTPITTAEHDYAAGSAVKADSLNDNQLQALYAIEESKLVTVTSGGGITTGSKNDITVNSDSDWVINSNSIEQSMMADNSVGLAEIKSDSVGTNELVDNGVTLAKMAGGTDGNLITYDASGDPAYVATGDSGTVLTSNGAGAAPTFKATALTPVGTVIWYAGSSAPGGYLKCNGDAIANGSGTTQGITANFSALYAIVGANLPDLRGEFIRGWDDGKGTDSGRSIRSTQTEAYKSHNHDASAAHDVDDPGHAHDMTVRGPSDSESTAIAGGKSDHSLTSSRPSHSETTGIDIDIAVTVEAEGGTETRPRNVALLACIKY